MRFFLVKIATRNPIRPPVVTLTHWAILTEDPQRALIPPVVVLTAGAHPTNQLQRTCLRKPVMVRAPWPPLAF
jgi:hypothetical protein